jgi:adenosylcobinamide kinase/adenosylcobinamide-phosphate guanylyltransferase
LTAALGRQRSPVILVTNEVGLGIVPDNALARSFRDAAGLLNLNVAGCPRRLRFDVRGGGLRDMKVK